MRGIARGGAVLVMMVMVQGCGVTQTAAYRSPRIGGDVLLKAAIDGNFPKTMLLIDEKNMGSIATSEVESMAISRIRDNGGQVVDQDMVRSNLKRDQTMLKRAGDNRGAASLGLQYGADVIIVGEAVAKPSARRIADSNLRSYEAIVTVKAVRTDNSELLSSASESSTIVALEDVSGSSRALKAAAGAAFDKLMPSMVKQYKSQPRAVAGGAVPKNTIAITVGGLDVYSKAVKVREALKAIEGVESVLQKNFTAGVAMFDVVAGKAAEDLTEDVVIKAPQGLKYQVLDVAPGKIELRAIAPK